MNYFTMLSEIFSVSKFMEDHHTTTTKQDTERLRPTSDTPSMFLVDSAHCFIFEQSY